MRTRPGRVEPEVYFRVVHLAQDGQSGAPVAAYREQTVEIALGPKGAFEKGNIGALTRRVPADRAVSVTPPLRGKPKPPKVLKTPRVSELLRKAIKWQALLESGAMVSQADIARREGITGGRVTQVMGMLRLAPEIQEHIQSMPKTHRRPPVTERTLRPIGTITDYRDQLQEFHKLLIQATFSLKFTRQRSQAAGASPSPTGRTLPPEPPADRRSPPRGVRRRCFPPGR